MACTERLVGAIGTFSNQSFIFHFLMLSTRESLSAQKIAIVHLLVHVTGAMCNFMAIANMSGATAALIVKSFVGAVAVILELWVWTNLLRPYFADHNRKLLNELPIKVFRLFFLKGGLTFSLYLYFEALGVSLRSHSPGDALPWMEANSLMITHFTLATALTITVLADSRISVSAILRGKAPRYVTVGFGAVMCNSIIPLALFAGREFADRRHDSTYAASQISFRLLWIGIFIIMVAGHSSPRTNRHRRRSKAQVGAVAESNTAFKDPTASPPTRLSGSMLSDGTMLTAGI